MKLHTFLCALLASFSLSAQMALQDALPLDPRVKTGKLPNGLTYYIQQNKKPEKKVELRLVVNTGSVLEDDDQQGLAHFMEHMGFNGSKNFPKNELVDYLQKTGVRFGADLNAYTSFDETVYILPIPSDNPETVEKGFTVLEDWAFNNLMDPAEIEKERGVVLEESRLRKGANERMSRQYYPKLFFGSKYGSRLPIGKDSVLQHFKPEVLQRFYTQWYRPELMAVIVVGDIDPAVAEQKIKSHFGKAVNPAGAPQRPQSIPVQMRTAPEAMVLTDPEATHTVLQVYNFVQPEEKIKTWADYRRNVVKELATALINQRLDELAQGENPPFLFAYTGFGAFVRGYESFNSFAVLAGGTAQQAVEVLMQETERARKFGFLSSELERAKASMMNGAERAYNERDKSESGQMVWSYVSHYLEGSPAPGPEKRYQFLKQELAGITLEEINQFAQQMPSNANAFALITAPDKMKEKLPDDKALLQAVVAAGSKPVTPYEEKAVAKSLMDKEPASGKIVSEQANDKLGTINLKFSNGITATLKPTTLQNDQIVMDGWRWGGFHNFSLADKENAKYAANLVGQMGVKNMPATEIRKFLSGKTVNVYPYVNNHEEGIEGSSSVKDFETFLQLVHLYFTEPRRDEALYNAFITKEKSSVAFLKQNPRSFFQDTLSKIIYKNNPWASDFPTEEALNKLSLDGVMAAYHKMFGNAHGMHFTFVGNLDMEKAKPMLAKYLGSLPGSERESKYKDNGVRPVTGVVEASIRRGKEAQSMISYTFTGDAKYSPKEAIALRAVLDILNIKVTEKLREEMSGIYGGGFYGRIVRRPYEYYSISATIPCGPENVDKLNAGLTSLIQSLQTAGPDAKDMDKIKESWRKQQVENLQSNDFWLSHLSGSWIDRNNPEAILDFEKAVDGLTAKDVQQAAQKYLNLQQYVKVVLYPETAQPTTQPPKAF